MASDRQWHICRHNENIQCQDARCNECGWNPVIAERRLKRILKRLGIERVDPNVRAINAVEAMNRIQMVIMPMVESGRNQWQIFYEVMKCITSTETLDLKDVRCKDCEYSHPPTRKGGPEGEMVCHNEYSPCNRRKVKGEDYCPYGERRIGGE